MTNPRVERVPAITRGQPLTIEIEGFGQVQVEPSFANLSHEEQQAVVAEIAQIAQGEQAHGAGQVQQAPATNPLEAWGQEGVRGFVGTAQGAGHVFDNAAELLQGGYNNTLGRAFGQDNSATEANAAGQGFEAAADQLGQGSEFGNTIGQIGASALLTRRLPGAFLPGAASGALMSDADTAGGVARDAAIGGVGGMVGDRVIRGAASAIAPHVSDAVRLLHGRGVRMTPGQAFGGAAARTEEKLASRPFVGDRITEGRRQSYRDFNRAAIEDVVAPYNAVGSRPVRLPANTTPQGVIRSVGDQLSDRYEKLVPNLSLVSDQQLAADIAQVGVTLRSGDLSPAAQDQFEDIIRNQVMSRLTGGATLDGQAYRQIERNLGRQISRYSRSSEPDHQAMAEAFEQVQDAFQGGLQRSNPRFAEELRGLNTSWRNLVRVEGAAAAPGARGGLFSPAQFRAAVRRGDASTRHRGMARGEAPMQDLAEAAVDVLPTDYPDSGTAGRQQMSMADPRYWIGALQGTVYTPQVQQGLTNALLAPRPQSAQTIADLLRALPAPQAGAAAGNAVTSPLFGPVP